MNAWEKILVSAEMPLLEAMGILDGSAMQILLVVDGAGTLLGTVTDGDIRRSLLGGQGLDAPVALAMNRTPICADAALSRDEALAMMRARRVRQVPMVDGQGRVVGLWTDMDVLRLGLRDNAMVIMAGGLGTRLRPLTQDCPKPLLPVGDRPLLETIIRNAAAHGLHRFYLCINYKGEMIQERFGDGSALGVDITYLRERERLGTAGALSLLPPQERPVVVMNGDVLTNVNLGALLDHHEAQGGVATMCLREYEVQVPFGVARAEGGLVRALEEKPVLKYLVSAGIYVIEPRGLARVPQGEFYDMPTLLGDFLGAGERVAAYTMHDYWLDIGRLSDFEAANRDFHTLFPR